MAYSLNQHKPRPDIKVGLRLNDHYAETLLPRIKDLLRHKHQQGFPGSQPVDFESRHIELLENDDYFVRDKTDGKRYIMFFTAVDGGTAFMMDELCKFRILTGFKLPLRSNPGHMHNETMMDGEVIMETDNNKQYYRYLIFDLMVLNGSVLVEKPYSKRMGMLRHDVLEPLNAALEKNVEMKKKLPLTMEIKSMELSYGLINVLQKIPSLKHGNDGLIFIPVNHPYEPGSCKKLLLWKPIKQLTVDFMIKVSGEKGEKKPIYQLLIFDDMSHKVYDYLTLEPDIAIQWQRNPPDGTVATFWYDKRWKTEIHREGMSPDSRDGGWRFIRFVREKRTADHEKVLEHVWKSIQIAVSQDMLENRQHIIRDNWKRRQSIQSPGTQPLPSPTSQLQTPSINSVFGSVSSSIPSQIFSNTQLVSPSVSSLESFTFKERRSSGIRDQPNKNESTESMEAITRSKFSQMLVTSPVKKSPTEDRSYFPPVYKKKSPDQTGPPRPNIDISLESLDSLMKPKDFQNSLSQVFESTVQEKEPPLDNSMMISPKNQLEKQSTDIQYSINKGEDQEKDPMEISEDTIHSEPFPETSPTFERSLPENNVFLKDSKIIRRNDIINHSSKLLEQSDDESNDEPDESNEEEVEQVSSDDDLSQKEHHRMSISSNIIVMAKMADQESSGKLSEQDHSHQQIEQDKEKDKLEPHESPMLTKDQNNSQEYSEEYWVTYEDEKGKNDDGYDKSHDSIKENNPPIQIKRNISSLKQIQSPTSEKSQFHQFQEQIPTSIPIQDAYTYQQQQQQNSFLKKHTIGTQPIKQMQLFSQPQHSLEQDTRLILEQSQDNEKTSSNQVISQEKIPESQEISFHSNVPLQKIQDNQPKNQSKHLQDNVLIPVRSQASIQENRTVSYNNVQHTSAQIISPIQVIQPINSLSQNQMQKNISTTSPLQQYQMLNSQSNPTHHHIPNQEIQPISILPLQSTNQSTSIQIHEPLTRKVNLPTSNINIQSQYQVQQKPQQSQLLENQQASCQPTVIPQQQRRQTISDSRSIITSQSQQIPSLQKNQLINSQSISPSMFDYQQMSNNQNINHKQWDMEQERLITNNNHNFQQAIKPMPRRHTLSGINNSLFQQNSSDQYQYQRHYPITVSSYPPLRQEILPSNISSTSQPISSSQHNLPLHSSVSTISQVLSQIPEEYSTNVNHNNLANVKFTNFTHNLSSQSPFQIAQQQSVTNNILPVLRPTPQKRKSKGALDFILNSGGESNQKRSKYDNNNDAN